MPLSSWGSGGQFDIWHNSQTQWMWEAIFKAEGTLKDLIDNSNLGELEERILKQAAREILLMQSSDWPFLVTTGQARQYAIERFKQHNEKFNQLVDMVKNNNPSEERLKEIEECDNCFEDIEVKDLKSHRQNLLKGTK